MPDAVRPVCLWLSVFLFFFDPEMRKKPGNRAAMGNANISIGGVIITENMV